MPTIAEDEVKTASHLSLDELSARPELAGELSPDALRDAYVRIHQLDGLLLAQLLDGRGEQRSDEGDSLVDVVEASRRLGKIRKDGKPSTDWVYRNAGRLPFIVRLGRQIRVSTKGLDRFIDAQKRLGKFRG